MNDKSLLKIALVCSMLGVTTLFFVSEFTDIDEKMIDEITVNDMDKNVKIIGTISNVKDTENVFMMDVLQSQEMKVVVF